ncbi:helix-turn-helix domain-containing protein [Microbacterium sp. NPDC056569]|uniref:helix-turn-helix domain-containing protein n=1 Tax=Microbacterium sp. NPDC056569 TaxID=3345867 RepID=UPI0036720652
MQREAAVAWFEQGLGDSAVASRLSVSRWAVRALYRRWKVHGERALTEMATRPRYSFEFELDVVQRVLAGEPKTMVATELALSSPKLIETWLRLYRAEGEAGLRAKPPGRPPKPVTARTGEETELDRLRRENERLRAEVAYLGKLRALMEQQRS